jgi:ribA/ribD-fused uncharacterized protein
MKKERKTIYFSSSRGKYGCFSNFARYPVKIDGLVWPSTEHYCQAQKFKDPGRREAIRKAKTPAEAARMGRNRRWRIRPDWDRLRWQVMRKAVKAKFDQHPELAKILVETRQDTIVERNPRDAYWGDGGDGRGQNGLGQILMGVRVHHFVVRSLRRLYEPLHQVLADERLVNRVQRSSQNSYLLDEARQVIRACEDDDPFAEEVAKAPILAQALRLVYRRLLEQDEADRRGIQ